MKFEHARLYAFVVGPYGFFRPRSRKCVRPSYGTFVNGFGKKALAGPYGSYDNCEIIAWWHKIGVLKILGDENVVRGRHSNA